MTAPLHWREYAIEAALLGAFMVSACGFGALLESSASPAHEAIASPTARRVLMGLAMGATAVVLLYSPWGKRSGAHMNPAVTLSFLRLGRVTKQDALGYITAHFVGTIAGVALMAALLHPYVRETNYVATLPGKSGLFAAWAGEFVIAFVMMNVVLTVNRIPGMAVYTGCFAAALVAAFITFEAPLSGMSLNPARTFGSAVFASVWRDLWLYFTAPIAGMLAAVELHVRVRRHPEHICGKLNHSRRIACLFRCNCLDRNTPTT